MPPNASVDDIRRALALPDFDAERAQRLMAPRPRAHLRFPTREGKAKMGGVLLLLYPLLSRAAELGFVLTKRTDTVATHRGQISLPGGAQEPGETLGETALREAGEELGVEPAKLSILGHLAPLYIFTSDYEVHPLVAYAPTRPDFRADPCEVAEVLEMSLRVLLGEGTKVEECWTVGGDEVDVPFYQLDGHAIWGATAMILSEFEQRIKQVIGA